MMIVTLPMLTIRPYTLAIVGGLLLYWNASLILSRSLTAVMATLFAMKLDLAFHLLYASLHHLVAIVCRCRGLRDLQDVLNHFQTYSQMYVIVDIASTALLVGNTLQFWVAALITRVALSALAARAEIWMRRWESQCAVDHVLLALGSVVCMAGCALQWAYYTLLPQGEMQEGGFATLLMWYTSLVYIVAVGVSAASTFATAFMRLCGYRVVVTLATKMNHAAARTLEDSGVNPYSEMHELYMAYLRTVVCAATAWYYAPHSLPVWIQGFVLLRLYHIASASGKLKRYKEVLSRFPSVSADSSKSCAICRDDFVSGEPVTCLPCGHTFHGACVRSWLMRAATCPTCRQPVVDAAARSGQSRHTILRSDGAGVPFTGSVQPLAPRLPAAAPQRQRSRSSRSGRPPPPSSPARGVSRDAESVYASLPNVGALSSIAAERQILARYRERLVSQQSTPVAAPRPPPPPLPLEDELESTAESLPAPAPWPGTEGDDVDPLLFTDVPLTPTEAASGVRQRAAAAAAEARRKRQRPSTIPTAGGESGTSDAASQRRRWE